MFLKLLIHRYRIPVYPRWLFVAIGMTFSLNACSWMIKPPEDQHSARTLVETAVAVNSGLNQYKGLAQARLQSGSESIRGRIALAAVAPNRMRVEWLSMLGQPMTSLTGDGQHITVLFHSNGKFYKLPQLRTSLERMVHIPIGINDLLSILSGRPPLPAFVSAQLDSVDQIGDRVVLKNRWRGIVAKLQVDLDTGRIQEFKHFDGTGNMRYEVQWRQWKLQGNYTIPEQVMIRSHESKSLTLTIERFWPNADVGSDMFVLSLPKKKT